jgi:hypothetical protein
MAEQYGIDKLTVIVDAMADIVNVVDQVWHKAGLMALLGLVQPITNLQGVDFAAVKQQISDLSADEQKQLENEFKSRVHLVDPVAQKKMTDGMDVIDEVITMVAQAIGIYGEGKDVVVKLKALFA